MIIPNLTYSSNLLISAPKIHTDLLWDLSVLFIVLAAVYFLGVFYFRNKITSKSAKVRERKRELSPMISEFLFLEDDASKDEKTNYITLKIEIRQLLKDDFNRQVLSEVLLDLRKDISGEAQQSLFRLYQDLGLHNDSFSKVKSWRWQIISKGIMELTQMEVAESYSFITKFINDKRSTIRNQAEIATVTLRQEGINYFLDTTKFRISEWQQLKLLDVLRNKEDFQPPRFKAWLTSNNKYVVLFALRLIKHYNQNDANASLIELVKHKNSQITEEAIACIKEFNVTESLDMLKLVFWNSTMILKIAILDAMADIGSEADIEFLNLIDKKELNFSVKSKALSTINMISPESIMPSKGLQDESRYQVPDDISEAVAKVHAKKHEHITGEKDEEILDEVIDEPLLVEAKDSVTMEEEGHLPETTEGHEEENLNNEEKTMPVETEELDTPLPILEINKLHDIEVEIEELIASEGESDKNDLVLSTWDNDHLNFIPLVVSEEEHDIRFTPLDLDDLNFKAPQKEALNIQVIDEEVVPYVKTVDFEVEEPNEENSSSFGEFHIEALAFLPVVVDNELETYEERLDIIDNEKPDLLEILVQYDEIQSDNAAEKQQPETTTTAIAKNDEPIHNLKDIKMPVRPQNDYSLNYEIYATDAIRNTTIIYEEISHDETQFDVLEIEVTEPFIFLSEHKTKQDIPPVDKQEEDGEEVELPIENEQLLMKIIDDLIVGDRPETIENAIDNDSIINPDWDLDEDELAFIPVSFDKDSEKQPSYIKIEKTSNKDMDEELNIPRASMPKAIFDDIDFEASTRQLLNDLEEMGDEREIPLLKELLAHDQYGVYKERINALIDTLNHDGTNETMEDSIHPFSVFQDLFRTCDSEAKLILLNVMVEVGDEKEIHFLEALTHDESPAIRKKAITVLKALKIKLEKNNRDLDHQEEQHAQETISYDFGESMVAPSLGLSNDPTNIFDLNFDLTGELDEYEENKESEKKKRKRITSPRNLRILFRKNMHFVT